MQQPPGKSETIAFLTYAEASMLLGVKVNTLYSWVSRRHIPFVRLGPRVVRFKRQDLDEWVSRQTVLPQEPWTTP